MTKKRFLTRVLPLIVVVVAIVVFLLIYRDDFAKGMMDAANNFK